jgi:hypothetical protein
MKIFLVPPLISPLKDSDEILAGWQMCSIPLGKKQLNFNLKTSILTNLGNI